MADIMGMNLFFMFLLNAYTFVFYVLGLLLFLALPRDRDIPWFLTPEDVLPMPEAETPLMPPDCFLLRLFALFAAALPSKNILPAANTIAADINTPTALMMIPEILRPDSSFL